MTSDDVINDSGWRIVKEQLRSAFVDVSFPFEDTKPEFQPEVNVLRTAFDEGSYPFGGSEAAPLPPDRNPYIVDLISESDRMGGRELQYTMPRLLVIVTEEQRGGRSYVPYLITSLNIPFLMFNEDEAAKSISKLTAPGVGERYIENIRLNRSKISELKRNAFIHFTPDQIAAIRSWLEYIWDTDDLREQDQSGELEFCSNILETSCGDWTLAVDRCYLKFKPCLAVDW